MTIIIKWILEKERLKDLFVCMYGSECNPTAGFCEHEDEPRCFTKARNFMTSWVTTAVEQEPASHKYNL